MNGKQECREAVTLTSTYRSKETRILLVKWNSSLHQSTNNVRVFQEDLWASSTGDKDEQRELPEAGMITRRCNSNNKQMLYMKQLNCPNQSWFYPTLDVWDFLVLILRVTTLSLRLWRGKHWLDLTVVCEFITIFKKPQIKLAVVSRVASDMQRNTALIQDCCACTEHIPPPCHSPDKETKC